MNAKHTIGVLGGTFDPFHCGHLQLALSIYTGLQLKEIRLIPCAQPLLRDPPIATPKQRLEMIKIAVRDYPELKVDDREIKQGGLSYTIDTVTALRTEIPDTSLCFIMSMDQFLQFDQWRSWEQILEVVHLIVASRPGYTLALNTRMQALTRQHQVYDAHLLHKELFGKIFFQSIPSLPISATEIRAQLKAGIDVQGLVPKGVWQYICEHELYR